MRVGLRVSSWVLVVGLGLSLAPLEVDAGADSRTPFEYRVGMADPHRHEFAVSLRFSDLPGPTAELELPKWNPGAYRLTDAHRNIRAVAAHPLDSRGEPIADRTLPVRKLDENTWAVDHGGEPFELAYRAYCGRYSGIGGCYLDDAMGFFNPAHTMLYVVGHKAHPIALRLEDLPGGKQAAVATGLPPDPKGARREAGRAFWAESYDALVDSPVHAGVFETVRFDLHGRPVRMILAGDGAYEPDVIREQVKAITEAATAVFGPPDVAIPFRDYTFIYHLLPDNGGGLEHRNSTVIGVDPAAFADEAGTQRFWSVTAHEFFHLWNVKRIRPAVLGPFDYDREVHTTMLWFSEGFTSYYAALILSRAGLLDERKTLASLARRIEAVETRPGRELLSVAQSSWETWAKPDDYDNAYFSYYDKGCSIGMLLDLHLRAVSKGQRSTDTVFQQLWARWRDTGLGLSADELEQAFVDQAGSAGADEVRAMFDAYVYGTAAVDYDRYLAHAGYRLDRRVRDPGPWIAVEARWDGTRMILESVTPGGPADRGGARQR